MIFIWQAVFSIATPCTLQLPGTLTAAEYSAACFGKDALFLYTRYVEKRAARGHMKLSYAELNVEKIMDEAFEGSGLRAVRLGNLLRNIGPRAFASTRLTGVSLPQSLTAINPTAFANTALRTIVLSTDLSIEFPNGCDSTAARDSHGWCDCKPASEGDCRASGSVVPYAYPSAEFYCAEDDDTFDQLKCCKYCEDGFLCSLKFDIACDSYAICDAAECNL